VSLSALFKLKHNLATKHYLIKKNGSVADFILHILRYTITERLLKCSSSKSLLASPFTAQIPGGLPQQFVIYTLSSW